MKDPSLNSPPLVLSASKARKPTPGPFRLGGRGSKQVSKAIEQIEQDKEKEKEDGICSSDDTSTLEWVFCTGKSPCFAKVKSVSSDDIESYLIQPMIKSPHDPNLLLLWEGHLWLAKRERMIPIKVGALS